MEFLKHKTAVAGLTVAIALTSLTISTNAKAFDWITAVTTVVKHVKNKRGNRDFKKSLQEKYAGIYQQVQNDANSSLEFLAEWQIISAEAAAISRVADRYAFVHKEGLKNPKLDVNSLSFILNKGVAAKIRIQCDSLKTRVEAAAQKLTSDVFNKNDLLSPARALATECKKLDELLLPVTPSLLAVEKGQHQIRALLNPVAQSELLEFYNKNTPIIAGRFFAIGDDGKVTQQVPSVKNGIRAFTDKRLTRPQKTDVKIETVNWIVRSLNSHLTDIKSEADNIQAFNGLYLKKLFDDSKKAQEQYLVLIGADATSLANTKFPLKGWVEIVEDVISKVSED